MTPIPLKSRYDGLNCPCDSGSSLNLDLSFSSEEDPVLPREGTITFRYKLRREITELEQDQCVYELRLMELTKFTGEKAKPDSKSPEESLDDLVKELDEEGE